MGQVSAKLGHGAFSTPTETIPNLGAGLAGLHKQHVALTLGPVGQEQGHRLGFIKTGEVPKVAVLAEGPLAVGVMGHQGCRRNHGSSFPELSEETLTPLGEGRRIDHEKAAGGPCRSPVWSRQRDRRWRSRFNR